MWKFHPFCVCLIICFSTTGHWTFGQEVPARADQQELKETVREMTWREAKAINHWWWGWMGGYSAATIGQGIAGFSSGKRSFRQDMFLSAATTFVGAIGQIISPVQPVKSRNLKYPANGSLISPGASDEEILQILGNMADAEKKGRSWSMHLASGAVNMTSGLVTWLGFKRTWQDGLVNFALNSVVTEVQIWSQPVSAKKIRESYLKNGKLDGSAYNRKKPPFSWSLYTSGNNFILSFRF